VVGYAVALRAEALDNEGDGGVRHGAMKQVPPEKASLRLRGEIVTISRQVRP
jgi:hypothetical protein